MRIQWTDPARSEFRDAITYIAADNPPAAARMRNRIVEAIQQLTAFPKQGRPGRVADTRELPIKGTSFVAVYRVDRNIVILRLLHGARRYP
jgi:toxin ParE1/3/4